MNLKYALRSEDTEQISVIQWAEWNTGKYPELKWLHHCPNGGSRNKQEAVKLKQMGVKSGVSDLCLPYPKGIYCGLYIEMKYGNNRQQPTQKEFLADMAAAGHFVATCYSAGDAIAIIKAYLQLEPAEIRGCEMGIPNNSIFKEGKVI
ncbi:MAG: VRR-NUC domain-containing protein [Lachnospiraceae bacterium]|nr:VRR-NUC domain-containing protein [Lachnospiraceae bacterium]